MEADWGYAPDYVEAMHRMLAQNEPDDYIVATGEKHSVREFAKTAFSLLGLDWRRHVRENPALISRNKCKPAVAAVKAHVRLARPSKFQQMIRRLLEAEGAVIMADKADVLVFVPTYNERENVERLCAEIIGLGLGTVCSSSMTIRRMALVGCRQSERKMPVPEGVASGAKDGVGSAHTGIAWATIKTTAL